MLEQWDARIAVLAILKMRNRAFDMIAGAYIRTGTAQPFLATIALRVIAIGMLRLAPC